MRRDLPQRDAELLRVVGTFRMMTRSQVKAWFFRERADPIVTRVIKRLTVCGYLRVFRQNGNGIQVVWLTNAGAEYLQHHGVPRADLFAAKGPVTRKDFDHTVAIVDVASWFAAREPAPDELLPAWQIQRAFAGSSDALPDLLVVWRQDGRHAVVVVEVDLGTEPVRSVLQHKFERLHQFAVRYFPQGDVAVAIFTTSEKRADSIRNMLAAARLASDVRLIRPAKC
jgi:Replication-relaxation